MELPVLQETVPDMFDLWRASESFLGSVSYGLADGLHAMWQTATLQRDKHHLGGQGYDSYNDRINTYIGGLNTISGPLLSAPAKAASFAEKAVEEGVEAAAKSDAVITLGKVVGSKEAGIPTAKAYIAGLSQKLPGNYTEVVMHGEELAEMGFWQFNKYLNNLGATGNLRLWICNGGANMDAIKLLAKRRGATVAATPHIIDVTRDSFTFLISKKLRVVAPVQSFQVIKP